MNVNFVPSLQHLTLAEIAIVLCNNCEIKALLGENKSSETYESRRLHCSRQQFLFNVWKVRHPLYANDEKTTHRHSVVDGMLAMIQGKVSSMITPLDLAKSLEKKVLSFVTHIVLEIEKWEEDHSDVLPAGYDAQVHFCWKSVGTIDREKTVENLLNCGNLSVKNRFLLACLYCMQDRLSSLWDGIYDSYKAHLVSKCHSGSLINYWTSCLDGLRSRSVFPDASCIMNVSALRYFYSECRNEDKRRLLLNEILSKQWMNLDLVYFCVPRLYQKSLEELSSWQCCNILRCFLNWPLQSSFLNMSGCLLVKLDTVEINDLLHDILRFINTHQYEDIDYLNLLKELWEQIPSCHKVSLMDAPDFHSIKAVLE